MKSISTSSTGNSNGKGTYIYVAPSIGKVIRDNTVIGVNLNYQHSSQSGGVWKTDAYGANLFLRKYKPLGHGFAAFVEGSTGANYTRQESNYPPGGTSVRQKGYVINAQLNAGIAYAISKLVQIETGFSGLVSATYAHQTTDTFDAADPTMAAHSKSNSFTIGTNLNNALQNFIVGVRFII